MRHFRGLYTALVTPFTAEGAVDFPALKRLVDEQLAAGVAGLVLLGTTAETPTLSYPEKLQVIEAGVAAAKGKCQLIAGVGDNETATSIELAVEAAKRGVDAIMVVTPYYNKPSQEGQYRHFVAVAEAAGLPTMLYNIKGRTGVNTDPATVARLAAHPLITAIKEASGDLDQMMTLRHMLPPDFSMMCGDDAWALPFVALGAVGLVSVTSNFRPAEMKQLVETALAGKMADARAQHEKLLPLMRAMMMEVNPVPVKTAMAMEKKLAEFFRLPLCEMMPENKQKLAAIVQQYQSTRRAAA